MDPLELLKYIGGGGFSFAILIFLLKGVNSEREKEREGRLKLLEFASESCHKDRQELRTCIDRLQDEIRTLYKTMLAQRTVELSNAKNNLPNEQD